MDWQLANLGFDLWTILPMPDGASPNTHSYKQFKAQDIASAEKIAISAFHSTYAMPGEILFSVDKTKILTNK